MSEFCFKVIWLKYAIAIAVDKRFKNNITIPITSFYFWPRVDGWKLLKHELELKPWLLKEEKIKILNGYTKIIHSWKENFKNDKYIKVSDLEKKLNFTLIAID
uniref:putative ribosomal protein 3 n=1 Tax=Vacuolaria virescens TaxID=44451 RepID=UPI00211457B8|nr:putative ribosomal protein 3 [Vacuolaria virescens]UTE94735.1 putative ribosomal protein 3 [Vacuolaria virescens]